MRNLLCKSMLSITTCSLSTFPVKIINLLFPNLYKANKLLTLICKIRLNSAGVPTRRQQASPSRIMHYLPLFSINIIIVHLFFCGLSVDLVWLTAHRPPNYLFFHPYCFSRQYSHFHPTDESGGYVSLSFHIVFYSTLLLLSYSTLHWYLCYILNQKNKKKMKVLCFYEILLWDTILHKIHCCQVFKPIHNTFFKYLKIELIITWLT